MWDKDSPAPDLYADKSDLENGVQCEVKLDGRTYAFMVETAGRKRRTTESAVIFSMKTRKNT